ncbi:MAG TPA: hypothetical protein VIA45_14985 [Thermoanaerobaculia bacterium]
MRESTIATMRNGFCSNLEMQTRTAAEQEIRLIQASLARLVRWAAALGNDRSDVVYLASDGFDTNVVDTYTKVIQQIATGSRACPGGGKPGGRLFSELNSEYGPKGGEMVDLAARSLAALGIQAIPVALGGNLLDYGNDASVSGSLHYRATSPPVPTFAGRVDPLRMIAAATGGEVVTSDRQMPSALEGFKDSYYVSYTSRFATDGKVHTLRVDSVRSGLVVRSKGFTTGTGTESLARGATLRALHEAPPTGGLPVRISLQGLQGHEKDSTATLHVDVDLESLTESLETLKGGRIRITMAVEVDGATEPFTTTEEFEIAAADAGWGADIPLQWPTNARRLAVTVEELRTTARGTSAIALPRRH